MHPPFPPTAPQGSLSYPREGKEPLAGSLRESTHRLQRSFILINAVPFTIGVMTSSFLPDVATTHVSRNLTVGVLWGFLQIVLFSVTAWWYASSSARLSDPAEHSSASAVPHAAEAPSVFGTNDRRR